MLVCLFLYFSDSLHFQTKNREKSSATLVCAEPRGLFAAQRRQLSSDVEHHIMGFLLADELSRLFLVNKSMGKDVLRHMRTLKHLHIDLPDFDSCHCLARLLLSCRRLESITCHTTCWLSVRAPELLTLMRALLETNKSTIRTVNFTSNTHALPGPGMAHIDTYIAFHCEFSMQLIQHFALCQRLENLAVDLVPWHASLSELPYVTAASFPSLRALTVSGTGECPRDSALRNVRFLFHEGQWSC